MEQELLHTTCIHPHDTEISVNSLMIFLSLKWASRLSQNSTHSGTCIDQASYQGGVYLEYDFGDVFELQMGMPLDTLCLCYTAKGCNIDNDLKEMKMQFHLLLPTCFEISRSRCIFTVDKY